MMASILMLCLMIAFAVDAAVGERSGKIGEEAGEKKAAAVNGQVITMSRLDNEMKRFEHHLGQMGQTPDEAQLSEMRLMVLDNFINRELLVQESRKQGITVGDQEVDEQMAAIKTRFADEGAFRSRLAQMALSEEAFKAQVAEELAIEKLIQTQVTDKVTITPQEVRSFYDSKPELFDAPERVRASHILAQLSSDASDDDKKKARKKIEEIRAKLNKGEAFDALAREHSDCPSAEKGGDLGYFSREQMVAPFADAAFALKPGEVSEVVETQFGYHVINLTEKKEAGITPYEEISERIGQHLKQEKMSKERDEYIAGLKSLAKIETFIN